MDHRTKYKIQNYKTSGRKDRRNLQGLRLGKDLIPVLRETQSMKEQIDKLVFNEN